MEYIAAKNILQNCEGGRFGSDYTVNLYRGCSHGCIYCDGRSDCYAIKRFDTVFVKRNALAILEDELAHKRKKGVIALGTMSDSYNGCEKESGLTRGALELIDKYGFGVAIETKSDLVLRDTDILQSIAKHSPVIVCMSVTTAYDELSRKLEPKVCVTKRRMEALTKLSDAGIYTGVAITPIIPNITDDSANIISIVDMAHNAGCRFVFAGERPGVTMRDSQRAYFFAKIEKLYAGLKEQFTAEYGDEFLWTPKAWQELYNTLCHRCREHGLLYAMPEIVAQACASVKTQQISLFDF